MSMPRLNIALSGEAIPAIAGRTDLLIGTLPADNPNVNKELDNVQGLDEATLNAMFGERSDLRHRIRNWMRVNKSRSRLDVKAYPEESTAVASEGKVTLSGTATGKGRLYVAVVDERQFFANIDVEVGETANDVATKIMNAFATTIFPTIPVTASLDSDDAKFTTVDKGSLGNYYGIKVVGVVAGLTIGVEAFAGGLNDPTFTTAFIPDIRFTGVGFPQIFEGTIDLIGAFMDERFNSDNKIMDGSVFIGISKNFSDFKAFVDGINRRSVKVIGNRLVPSPNPNPFAIQSGASILTPVDWSVAEFMGIRSLRMTPDAPISDYVFANNLDAFGGAELASLPYFNTPMRLTAVTKANMLFNETEKLMLEESGGTVIDVNVAENGMLMGSVVSTYKTNEMGIPDSTWKYLNYIDTGSVCREYIFNNMKSDLAQSRLTEGDLVPNRNIHNAGSIEALFMRYYSELAGVLYQDGAEIVSDVADGVTVELDLAKRLVTLIATVPIVTQIGQVNMLITQKFTVLG